MSTIESICVFCGGSDGNDPIFKQEAYRLGQMLARNNTKLIFGAGGTGLMNAVFRGTKDAGGYVVGVTIKSLFDVEKPDISQEELDEFMIFKRMSDRKVYMCKQASAMCILPGGLGTLDEFFEIMTLRQLNISRQPIVLVNINGFFNPVKILIDSFIEKGFIKPKFANLFQLVDTVDEVLPYIDQELRKISQNEDVCE